MDDKKLTLLINPILVENDLELDSLSWRLENGRSLLRITVDGATDINPNLDQITKVSKAISSALDKTGLMGDRPYQLEVSTRGITKPLTEIKHFRRNIGRLIKCGVDDSQVSGRIKAVTVNEVTLEVSGQLKVLPIEKIVKAQVQVEFNQRIDSGAS